MNQSLSLLVWFGTKSSNIFMSAKWNSISSQFSHRCRMMLVPTAVCDWPIVWKRYAKSKEIIVRGSIVVRYSWTLLRYKHIMFFFIAGQIYLNVQCYCICKLQMCTYSYKKIYTSTHIERKLFISRAPTDKNCLKQTWSLLYCTVLLLYNTILSILLCVFVKEVWWALTVPLPTLWIYIYLVSLNKKGKLLGFSHKIISTCLLWKYSNTKEIKSGSESR